MQPQQEIYTNDSDGQEAQRPGHTRRQKMRINPLVWLGLGMLAMILLWVGFSNLLNWWTIHQDDSTYGRPRTFQTDAVVGHDDSTSNPSHFIAINLNRHVIVIELPGGDPAKARIYPITTLFGDGQELTPDHHVSRRYGEWKTGYDNPHPGSETCDDKRKWRLPATQSRGEGAPVETGGSNPPERKRG